MKLKISKCIFPHSRWQWEMADGKIYVCTYLDDGYSTKASAKRAGLRVAEKLGITITGIENED
jgi:hypothetical protein